jgi:hypothetical protein
MESGGIGARVQSLGMRLHDAAGATVAEGSFDTAAVTQLAGTARLPADGRLDVPSVGPHYDAAKGGRALTLTYTVTVLDDNGHTLSEALDVPVHP